MAGPLRFTADDIAALAADQATTMIDANLYEVDPERVRDRLRDTAPGNRFVFKTFAADGSLSVGVARGRPDPSLVLVVVRDSTESVALAAARGPARWHRSQGRITAAD